LNLAVVEQIPARGLVLGQIMRLHDLNPASAGSSAFRIDLYNGNPKELNSTSVDDYANGFFNLASPSPKRPERSSASFVRDKQQSANL
jgi:hypothetical protein